PTPLTCISPSLGYRLGRHRRLAPQPVFRIVRKRHADVHLPTTSPIRSHCYAHRSLPLQRWRGLLARALRCRLRSRKSPPVAPATGHAFAVTIREPEKAKTVQRGDGALCLNVVHGREPGPAVGPEAKQPRDMTKSGLHKEDNLRRI